MPISRGTVAIANYDKPGTEAACLHVITLDGVSAASAVLTSA